MFLQQPKGNLDGSHASSKVHLHFIDDSAITFEFIRVVLLYAFYVFSCAKCLCHFYFGHGGGGESLSQHSNCKPLSTSKGTLDTWQQELMNHSWLWVKLMLMGMTVCVCNQGYISCDLLVLIS